MLAQIEKILKKAEIDCTLYMTDISDSAPTLHIPLPEALHGKPQILYLTHEEQIIPGSEEPDLHKLAFTVPLDISVEPMSVTDTARFLCLLNRHMDLPGFEMDEIESNIQFRHVWIGSEKSINALFLQSLTGLIMLLLDLYYEPIRSVAAGEQTFEYVITDFLAKNEQV